MSVYVDDQRLSFGRMLMCHMVADSHDELMAIANKIGVAARWIQKPGTLYEHFDICLSKRELAVRYGAREVGMVALGKVLLSRRAPSTQNLEPGGNDDGNLKAEGGGGVATQDRG